MADPGFSKGGGAEMTEYVRRHKLILMMLRTQCERLLVGLARSYDPDLSVNKRLQNNCN